MANTITMPKLSPTMEEGQISRWLKKEGDAVEANEPIAEVDTDKATMEVTSLDAGTLLKIVIGDGANAKLGEIIGIIGEKGEDFSALLKGSGATNGNSSPKTEEKTTSKEEKPTEASNEKTATSTESNNSTPKNITETEGRSYDSQRPGAKEDAQKTESPKAESPKAESNGNGRMIVSPIAARMAAENNVDLKSLKGSGPNGRIIKRDIEEALSGKTATAETSREETSSAPSFAASTTQGAVGLS